MMLGFLGRFSKAVCLKGGAGPRVLPDAPGLLLRLLGVSSSRLLPGRRGAGGRGDPASLEKPGLCPRRLRVKVLQRGWFAADTPP